jgi:hypothetical protein
MLSGFGRSSPGTNSINRPVSEQVTPPPSASPASGPKPASFLHRLWKRATDRRFLFISVLVHILFALIAVYLVVQTITPKRKLTFKGGPPSPNPNQRVLEHKVSLAKKQKAMSAPAPAKRITTTAMSKVALPEMPSMPTMDNSPLSKMAGMAPGGLGMTMGGSGGTGDSGGGGGVPFFGLRTGEGLEGHFYDLKRDQDNHPTGMDLGKYGAFLKRFTNGSWSVSGTKHFTSKATLYSKFFFFPAIKDTEAGKAFQSPETGPGMWIAHYTGSFRAPEDGTWRLVGFGDNVMIVRIGGSIVLDASDHGYTGRHREQAGDVKFPEKPGTTPVFFGTWFSLRKGDVRPIEVLVGDEGGIYCAGLFLQKQGQPYEKDRNGIPHLPLLFLGTPSSAERQALLKYLPSERLNGPYFPTVKGGGTSGLLPPL